uniref:Uncharacterized protein n=1 Tax=Aegilops tauschii subsp. strangulata TaxID=200361 RepID=A0A453L4X6_AEGTS
MPLRANCSNRHDRNKFLQTYNLPKRYCANYKSVKQSRNKFLQSVFLRLSGINLVGNIPTWQGSRLVIFF